MEAADASPSSDRGVVLGSLLLLAVATAVGFGRVFAGLAPTGKLAAAAVLAVLIASLLRRRGLVLTLAASAVALAFVVGVFVFPNTLAYGVPAGRTFEAVVRALGDLGEDAVREVAPAPPLRSLMTASLFAVWAAATAAHALAVRARSPMLALLPGAVLLAFAGVVTEGRARPVYAVTYLIASIGVLFGASIDRLALWGPLVDRPGRRKLAGGTTGRWARRLGVAAVLVAIAIPGALPGYGSNPILQVEPGAPTRISINPIVDIRPSLLQQPAAELFVVESERAAYWRMLSLDTFDGRTWSSTDPLGEDGQVVSGEESFVAIPPGDDELEQTFEIRALSVPWLPAAYRIDGVAFDVDGDGGSARWDAESSVLSTNDRTEEGDRYTIRSALIRPTPKELDTPYDPGEIAAYADYLQVPADLPGELEQIARRITRGEDTPYRQALAIQAHLKSFEYDLNAPAGHGVNDIQFFLTESQRGYCEQFAGTMAVLLRLLDIPSRVAVGFIPGTFAAEDGRWHVTTQDAHAWVEAYFPGYGWLAFEPTPTRSNPVAQSYLAPLFTEAPRSSFLGPRERGANAGQDDERASQQDNERAQGGASAPLTVQRPSEPARRWPLGLILLAIAAVAAVLFAVVRELARRVALARPNAPRERVLTAYRVFEASAADVGSGRRRGETLAEYRARLAGHLRRSDGLERLAALSMRAAYSVHAPTEAEGREAVDLCRSLVRDVRRRAGVARAAAGAVRPVPPL